MKIDFELLSIVYDLLNVDSINNIIDGEIYNGDKPVASKSQDITMNVLSNVSDARGIIQRGVLNINCWCIQLDNGVADNSKLSQIAIAVFNALGIVNDEIQVSGLTLKLDSAKTFRDNSQDSMFYTNIRLNYSFKN